MHIQKHLLSYRFDFFQNIGDRIYRILHGPREVRDSTLPGEFLQESLELLLGAGRLPPFQCPTQSKVLILCQGGQIMLRHLNIHHTETGDSPTDKHVIGGSWDAV